MKSHEGQKVILADGRVCSVVVAGKRPEVDIILKQGEPIPTDQALLELIRSHVYTDLGGLSPEAVRYGKWDDEETNLAETIDIGAQKMPPITTIRALAARTAKGLEAAEEPRVLDSTKQVSPAWQEGRNMVEEYFNS